MSKTITRTDLTNILNTVLPAGGGGGDGLIRVDDIDVTANDNDTIWSLSSGGSELNGLIPIVALCNGLSFPCMYGGIDDYIEIIIPAYAAELLGLSDTESCTIDSIWCVQIPI